jgi:hypothetical protein
MARFRSETPILIELMMKRTENLSFDCIRELSSLVGGNSPSTEKAGSIDEEQAMRSIILKLAK